MKPVIVDAGPFIHLTQINQINLLKKFSAIYSPDKVISEISPIEEIIPPKIRQWRNLEIVRIKEKNIPEIEKVIKEFGLHNGEKDVLYLARKFHTPIVLTDDLDARNACGKLGIEVHGTVGIIAYAFYHRWISLKKAEESLILLYRKSSLFIASAIIESAIRELRKQR